MAGSKNQLDELSNLKIVKEDDRKIIAAAKWMPRLELVCCNKHCLLLGGHTAATNSIMVWCTCDEPDDAHPESSRLLAMDFWVVEHCRGERLASYEEDEDEEDEDAEDPVDKLCVEQTMVVRAGPNVLAKQVTFRQFMSSALVAQGGNKGLKGVGFWVYWYDQDIPTPKAPQYAGVGRTWAPGQLAVKGLGVWYRARILKCDTATGLVHVRYDADGNEDKLYLLVAFAHFDQDAPPHGATPEVLPLMDKVKLLGLAPSAVQATDAKGAKGAAGFGGATQPTGPAATTAAAKPPPVKVAAAAPPGPSAKPAAAPTAPSAKPAAAPTAPAAKPVTKTKPAVRSSPAEPKQKLKAKAPALAATAAAQQAKAVLGNKRPLSPNPPASAAGTAAAAAKATAEAAAMARGSKPAGLPAQGPVSAGHAAAPGRGPGRPGTAAPPGKRSRHEFECLLLAGLSLGPAAARPGPVGSAPVDPAAWAGLEAEARKRRGFRGLLCGGQEQVPVFVFNEVDAAPIPQFEYLTGPRFESRLEQDCAAAARQQPAVGDAMEHLRGLCSTAQPPWGGPCGLEYHRAVWQREQQEHRQQSQPSPVGSSSGPEGGCYSAEGRLLATRPLGVHECSPSCASPACRANRVVTIGPRRALEVFRTADRRWALRCPQPLEPGDFVAPLLGKLVPAAPLAEPGAPGARAGGGGAADLGSPGVVLLNHFFGLWEVVFVRGLYWCERHLRLWQLPPNPLAHALCTHSPPVRTTAAAARTPAAPDGRPSDPDSEPARPAPRCLASMLALDTRSASNVARFVRQWTPGGAGAAAAAGASCAGGSGVNPGPALVAQPVLAGLCRSPLLYYVGLYAARRVEAMEELTCDFADMALEGGVGPGGLAGPAQ